MRIFKCACGGRFKTVRKGIEFKCRKCGKNYYAAAIRNEFIAGIRKEDKK